MSFNESSYKEKTKKRNIPTPIKFKYVRDIIELKMMQPSAANRDIMIKISQINILAILNFI